MTLETHLDKRGGPHLPMVAATGGRPTKLPDVPVLAVFIVLFLASAVTHMTILQRNRRRGKKFLFSGALFGFSMARIVACIMRLVLVTHSTNVSIAIAAQVFVAAGVIIAFIVNLFFAQRILRSVHPHLGWAKWLSLLFKAYYASIIIVIIILITATVQSFFATNPTILLRDKNISRFGVIWFAVSAFMPVIVLAITFIIPRRGPRDEFGEGSFSAKVLIVLVVGLLATLGAAFRAGTSFVPRPITNPAWYHSKACFYIFNFVIDWLILAFFAVTRVDKRFWVPNGCKAPGDYMRKDTGAGVGDEFKEIESNQTANGDFTKAEASHLSQ